MSWYGIVTGNSIERTTWAETESEALEIAKEIHESATVVECGTDGKPWVGWTLVDGEWVAPELPETETTV